MADPIADPTPDPVVTPDPKADPPPKPTPADDMVSIPKAEHDAQQAALASMRREVQKTQDAAKKAAEDKAREAGEHEKLANQYQAERDAIQAELAQERATARVRAAASRHKFRNPDDAVALLPASVDREDEAAVDTALKQLAGERKYLIDDGTPVRTGGPAGGGDPPDNATLDEQLAAAAAKGDWDKHRELNKQKLAQVTGAS